MTTAEIMDAMKYDGALVTIERLQVHSARLERLLSNERERCAKVLEGEIFPVDCFSKESPIVGIVKAAQAAIRALPEAA